MQDFRNIIAWQKAHEPTLMVYRYTQQFPAEERFAMQSQMRRAAFSVPANIAEGSNRKSDRDFGRFLEIAPGSHKELQYSVMLAADLRLLDSEARTALEPATGQTFAPLSGLMKRLETPTSSFQP